MHRFRDRGGRIVSFSPLRDDVDGDCEWHAPVPGTDVAIMLALAHVLATESLADREFLDTYCTGYDRFERYLLGTDDGVPKSPQWASAICGLAADDLTALARRMAAGRTIVTVSWSLQRTRHGEQAPWMGLTLAAMLGQIGLPGGGFGHGYGSMNEPGLPPLRCRLPSLPQGAQPGATFIPVAAVSDMLLHPGEPFDYNGRRLTYPDIKLVYWAGGNPFHHHQNIPRLRRALGRVDTVVVHDPYWTAMAKHADIVVPSTTAFERDDFSGSRNDPLLMAMPKLTEPYAQSRDDYTTFAALAERARLRRAVHRGPHRAAVAGAHVRQVGRRTGFRGADVRRVLGDGPVAAADRGRADPAGRLPRRPVRRTGWTPPAGASRSSPPTSTGSATTTAPATRSGSSRPNGSAARARRAIRCTCWPINPRRGCTASSMAVRPARTRKCQGANRSGCTRDAAARGLVDGDVVRVFNDRGACLAGVVIDDRVRPQVVQLSTGAWFDPADPPTRTPCACTAIRTC